jgi:Outer membrane protein beta-barrel domain
MNQIKMKSRNFKISILLILFTSVSIFVNAQTGVHESFFRVGAKAGVNINKIDGRAYGDAFNYNFQAGVFVQLNLTNKIGIQPEVNFVQSQSEFSDDANNVYYDLFGGGTQHRAKLDYLEVPVFLNINLGPSKKVKLQVGPAYGGLLKQTVDSLKAGSKNLYRNGDWSAIGGLWIQLPLINLSARYKLGLSNVNAIDDRQQWKNQAIQISVGITL